MAELKQLEFFLLRYVPDAVKGEFVNIGVMVREAGRNAEGFRAVRITQDWGRVRCIDPEADLGVLQGIGTQMEEEVQAGQEWEAVVAKVEDSFSNVIQISPVKACLSEDAERETAVLTKLYLERHGSAERSVSARRAIVKQIEEALQTNQVLKFMQRDIWLTDFTGKKGDPQRFDFACSFGEEVRFLQAMSLGASIQQALILGARLPGIERDVYAAQKLKAGLTVVVEDGLDRTQEEIGFALGMMRENRIRVEEARGIPRIAAEIRQELRV